MRDIGSVVKGVLEDVRCRQVRDQMIDAHQAAEEWHYWMGRALRLERECAEYVSEHRVSSLELEREYREAIRESAEAMQKVPMKWLAILGAGVSPRIETAAE
jgi:hypothetical protein